MEMKSTLTNRSSQVLDVVWYDLKNSAELDAAILDGTIKNVSAVTGFCFYGEKMVIVYAENKKAWGHPGGGRESGESVEQALVREVKEETNMRVLSQHIIGYQNVFESDVTIITPTTPATPPKTKIVTQTRSLCIVEPYGPFVADPDGDITEIRLIDPSELTKYVDWGKIGAHILRRAMEIKSKLEVV